MLCIFYPRLQFSRCTHKKWGLTENEIFQRILLVIDVSRPGYAMECHDCPFAWNVQIMCPAMWWGPHYCSLIPRPLLPPAHLQPTSILEFLQRGEAWRIWSRTMTSGRQTVDTQEAVDLKALSCNITGLEAKSICEAASIQFVVHNAWNYYSWAPPPVCLPLVPDAIMLDQISHASPSVFAYCKWSKTIGVRAAREVEAIPGPATSFTIAVESQGMRLTYMVAI